MMRGGDNPFNPAQGEIEDYTKVKAAELHSQRIEEDFNKGIEKLVKKGKTRKEAEDEIYKTFVGHKMAQLTGHKSSFGGTRKKHRKLYKMRRTRKLRGGLDAMEFRKMINKERGVNKVGTTYEDAESEAYKKFVEDRMKQELAARKKEEKKVVPGAVPLLGQTKPLTVKKGGRHYRRRLTRRRR
jgi:hypothetical protein